MKKKRANTPGHRMAKGDFERLAHFRYQLRRFLRFSEEMTRRNGITALQYLLLLQIKGFPGREWATVGELAERLQAKQHGVVSLISRCETAGLVRRTVSRSDRRRVEVNLTRKGGECLEHLAQLHRRDLLSLQGQFAVPDLTAFSPETGVGNPSADRFSAKRTKGGRQ
ncbi:MAG TPA: MarR family transcriptional regulator [Casimicrobiaceae bacterium]|jgi:DNA-binding MarR family transcriptional regulator